MRRNLNPPRYAVAAAPGGTWTFLAMVGASGVWLAAAALGALGAVMSPIVFFEQGSMLNPLAWAGFLLVVGFWAVCLLAPCQGWVLWSRRQPQRAWAFMAMPLAWGVATLAVLELLLVV